MVSALLQGLKSHRDFKNLINLTTPSGETALRLACANGNTTVVRLLVEAGADQRMRSRGGLDAFGIALALGHDPVCELLQPTRNRLLSTFSSLNTVDAFMRARQDLTLANVGALERELSRAGVLVAPHEARDAKAAQPLGERAADGA